jgi:hypothetical protein
MLRDTLNKFIYVPSKWNVLINACYFAVIFILVVWLGYNYDEAQKMSTLLSATDSSLPEALFVLLLGLLGSAVIIVGKTRKNFICMGQCLRAAAGTALLLTALTACVWCLLHVQKGSQQFVLLRPRSWGLQATLNNLKYGATLVLLSSALSLIGKAVISVEPEHDFGKFEDQWRLWKGPVEKLGREETLTGEEHRQLLDATKNMQTELGSFKGHVQPVALRSAQALLGPLRRFDIWYQNGSRLSYMEVRGLDEEVRPDVEHVLRRC